MNVNKKIKKQIEDSSFSLASHPVFSSNPKRLMEIGVNRTIELAERRLGNTSPQILYQMYHTLFSMIEIEESKFIKELEHIAEEVIRDMYQVPEQILIKPKIVEQDEIQYEFELQKEEQKIRVLPERFKIIQEEVDKRIILNSIVNGSSVMIWSSAYYIANEKINKINPSLIKLYDDYSAVVNCLLWMQDPEIDLDLIEPQGICELNFESGHRCEGINFPVLLLETNKILMDFLICQAIPKDFNEEELKLYYALADDYSHEIWHNTLSPVLYNDFLETIDTEPEKIPGIISRLCGLEYAIIKDIFIDIQENKEEAIKKLKYYNIC